MESHVTKLARDQVVVQATSFLQSSTCLVISKALAVV